MESHNEVDVLHVNDMDITNRRGLYAELVEEDRMPMWCCFVLKH